MTKTPVRLVFANEIWTPGNVIGIDDDLLFFVGHFDRHSMLVDRNDLVNKYWDHREKIRKTSFLIYSNQPKKAELKLWKIPIQVGQPLVEG